MKNHFKDIMITIGVIILYIFYSTLALIPLILAGVDIENMSTLAKILFLLISETLFVVIIFLIYKHDMIADWKDFKTNYKEYFKKYIKYWFWLLLFMYASNLLILGIQRLFNHKEVIANNEELVRDILERFPIYMIISAVILGPIEEEIVYRKSIRKVFNNKWLFIIISGLFFGAMHVVFSITDAFDLLYIISYSIPGFIFAYVYYDSKNIYVSTMLHTIHNGVLIGLQLLLSLI